MRCQGTLYITPRHVCFADASMAAADDRKLFKLPLDRVLRVDVVSKNTISVVPLNNRPYKFTKIGDCDAVCRVLFKQVCNNISVYADVRLLMSMEMLVDHLSSRPVIYFCDWDQVIG